MNKKLLAVAVASALGAPVVAFAQSSVTLYGSIDVAYVSKIYKAANGTTVSYTQGIGEGWNAGNRIGFRGSEDLGGGMTALFNIEQGINITNGALFTTRAATSGQQYDGVAAAANGPGQNMPAGAYSTSTNRQSFVGLKGGWGELLGGYQYTTLYRISTLSGYFIGSEQPGGDVAHGTLSNGDYGGTRANGLVYNSPIFADGFQVTVQKGATTGRENADFAVAQADGKYQNNAHRWSLMPTYNKGPLSLAIGYTKVRAASNYNISQGTNCFLNILGVCSAITAQGTSSVELNSHLWQFAGSYTMSAWKFMGTYANGKKNDTGIGGFSDKTKAYQGGVEFTAGAWRPFIMIGRGTYDTTATVTAGQGTGRVGDYKLYQFGVRYDLSKRAMLYAMYGQTKDNANLTVTGAAINQATFVRKRDGGAAGMYFSF